MAGWAFMVARSFPLMEVDVPFPERFPAESGLYTHVIGKLPQVFSKQKLGQCMIGSTGKGVS